MNIYILFVHYVVDFLLQTRKMGENKGKDFNWLTVHIAFYTLGMAVMLVPFLTPMQLVIYVCINSLLHYLTDFLTSKGSGYCYLKSEYWKALSIDAKGINERVHVSSEKKRAMWMGFFWKMIGLDQFIHGACLWFTYDYFILQNNIAFFQNTSIPYVALMVTLVLAYCCRGFLFFIFDIFRGKS